MKALIVEDHPPTARLLSETLRRGRIDSEICGSAEDAMSLVSASGVSAFDIFLLDLQLPGIDGIALCDWIRRSPGGRDPYITVVTGADYTEKLGDAFEAGADDYLEKPLAPKALSLRLAVAREHIEVRRERRRLNRELTREKDFIAAVFDTAAACIAALDPQGRIVTVNQATADLTGKTPLSLKGLLFGSAVTAGNRETAGDITEKLNRLADGNDETCQFESRFSNDGNSARHLTWLCRRVDNQSRSEATGKSEPLIVCVGTDITERRKMEARLAHLAKHDSLTNLYNRSQLEPAVRQAIDGTRDRAHPAALVYIDLDHFKTVNDTAGHAAGDRLLQLVSDTLSENTRPSDTVIRLGGDEFVLVLPDSPTEKVRAISERIRNGIDQLRFKVGDRTFPITASIGVAMLYGDTNVEETLARADEACYNSKHKGRNRIHICSPPTLSASPASPKRSRKPQLAAPGATRTFSPLPKNPVAWHRAG